MDISFKDSSGFTLGVELEVQLVDRAGLGLVQTSSDIIASLPGLKDHIKHELMMSNIEIVSGVCPGVAPAGDDLLEKLKSAFAAAEAKDTLLCLASTHPFSSWKEQRITEDERYMRLLENLQVVARRFSIYGLHVHVGVAGGERCIHIMNRMLYYLPHLLALTANSPYWEGMDTGLASYRTKVFETLPIAGLPFYFNDWSDYTSLVNNYLSTGTIKTIRELWWDIRPHPDFGTIEVRVCDMPSTMKEILAVTALIQCMVRRFSGEFDRGLEFTRPHSAITRENKWRACRWGLDARLITESGDKTVPARDAIGGLVRSLEAEAAGLNCLAELKGAEDMLRDGTGAERQRRLFRETGSLKGVVKGLCGLLAKDLGRDGAGLR